jgi:hypothetical protein
MSKSYKTITQIMHKNMTKVISCVPSSIYNEEKILVSI